MLTISQIVETLNEDTALKILTQTYSEVAATKLSRIRSRIERNRGFAQNLEQIYFLVRAAAPGVADPRSQKQGIVSLLLTSNYRFYGNLEENLIKLFATHTPEFPTERIVVGKMAAEYLRVVGYRHPFTKTVFSGDLPTPDELSGLMAKISGFQRIFVYYSRFKTVLSQQPTFTDITGASAPTAEKNAQKIFYYIFEPEAEMMLRLIDAQMIMLLLEQAFLEAELARTAARLMTMEQAQNNAAEVIKSDRKVLGLAQKQLTNNRLLEMIITLQRAGGAR